MFLVKFKFYTWNGRTVGMQRQFQPQQHQNQANKPTLVSGVEQQRHAVSPVIVGHVRIPC